MIVYSKNTGTTEKINTNEEFSKESISKINLWNEKLPYVWQWKFCEDDSQNSNPTPKIKYLHLKKSYGVDGIYTLKKKQKLKHFQRNKKQS